MRYEPALDGLRAWAVLGVICAHTQALFLGGGRGVDVFFVLSGYLITSILLNRSDVADFYFRRAKRLMPALVLFLTAYIVIAPFVFPTEHIGRDALFAFIYMQNWALVWERGPNALAHTWSLAVEAQFYLLWPFAVAWVRKLSMPLVLLASIWFLLTVLRWWMPEGDWRLAFFGIPFHATGLILGSMIALKLPTARLGWPAFLALGLVFIYGAPSEGLWATPATEIATAFLIPALLSPGKLRDAFAFAPLAWIGLISYGIYLWHYPFALALEGSPLAFPVTACSAILLAALSYYLLERPISSGTLSSARKQGLQLKSFR